MRIRKVIHKPVEVHREGINLVGGLDAVINANIQSGKGSVASSTSHQVTRIVQQGSKRRPAGEHPEKEVEQ